MLREHLRYAWHCTKDLCEVKTMSPSGKCPLPHRLNMKLKAPVEECNELKQGEMGRLLQSSE